MLAKRIIPCLDVDAGRVVKGTNFVDIRDAGDPVELAERYDRAARFGAVPNTWSHQGALTPKPRVSSWK